MVTLADTRWITFGNFATRSLSFQKWMGISSDLKLYIFKNQIIIVFHYWDIYKTTSRAAERAGEGTEEPGERRLSYTQVLGKGYN